MSVPLKQNKHGEASFFDPQDFISYMRSIDRLGDKPAPESAILCYQGSLFEYVKKHHEVSEHPAYFGSKMQYLEEYEGRIAVIGGFGVGAPAAAVMLEELIAYGVRNFVSLGWAGSLRDDLGPGGVLVCDGALRDEGLSYHYLEEGVAALPDAELTADLVKALETRKTAYSRGLTWTTDAIYRETRGEIAAHREAGASVVEMEAAALFAVAAYRKARIASFFTVSDTLTGAHWKPAFHSPETAGSLETLFRVSVEALDGRGGR